MHSSLLSNFLAMIEFVLCSAALITILFRKQQSAYKFLCFLLGFRIGFAALWLPLIIYSESHIAYKIYFYTYWASFAIESILVLLLIHRLFHLAMAPLAGLRSLGKLVFRWAAGISFAVAIGSAIAPHETSRQFIITFVSELQRTQSILALCLLLFVCFSIRPLGLTYRSRIFGVSLGLGILASSNLIFSAMLSHMQTLQILVNIAGGVTTCVAMLLLTIYFALPEPKRRIVVLPTTSPFLRWNHISQVLGDAPGFVAIAGVPPELFAPAELEIMRRASLKMSQAPLMAQQIQRPQSA